MSSDHPDTAPRSVGGPDSPVGVESAGTEPVGAERPRGRRPRRAVRLSDTVGSDESVLRSTLPAYRTSGAAPDADQDPGVPTVGELDAQSGTADPAPATLGGDEPAVGDASAASLARLLDRAGDLSRSADDGDQGWGDGAGTNDERLARDRPPHW
ncbi:hypothetical protein [Cellulomonas soli]|uniref:Uncharacterized protein n=1 Tax=Cellulomonas soli TaxID=931535 RepID=A0A512PGY8_9CELL|nr:hypothetical protein [Cellulomonas soli]NYI59663.1 hypothetical protein [Cellulomonas soli]GEP70457.1 hypothetical protein CSO01_31720 [Cellulomonas soli]